MKFRNLDIRYDMGAVDDAQISNFEKMFKITLPRLYIELIRNHNALRVAQDYFDYYDSYRKEESLCSFGFDGFETEEYLKPSENIYAQYLYDDEIYGYEHVYSFGSTACGDFICFDYRDDPKGDEPKICIVIHDEYDEETGKRLLFPVAENFEAFLNSLKSFDEMMEKYS